MKPISFRRFGRPCLLLLCVALLAGCATVPPGSCEHFEQTRRASRYETTYRYSETDTRLAQKNFAPLRSGEPITARWYTLRSNRAVIRGCDHLYLTKDLYLLRGTNGAGSLHEVREVFTSDGTSIATKREDVTAQLKASGFYSASVPLPIPKQAPPGAYRIVTKLIAKTNGSERALATASVDFRVQ